MSVCNVKMYRENTDGGHTNAPVLKRHTKTLISRQEAQDQSSIEEAGFTMTDAFKVPDENNAVGSSRDYEIAAIPGHMCYRKNLSRHPIVMLDM